MPIPKRAAQHKYEEKKGYQIRMGTAVLFTVKRQTILSYMPIYITTI